MAELITAEAESWRPEDSVRAEAFATRAKSVAIRLGVSR